MYQRALQGYEKAWGPDHISTLGTVNNLGILYANQDKLDEAEKMYQRAREKALGPDHTSTLDTVNNLGILYMGQGKLDEAEKMYQRACIIRFGDGQAARAWKRSTLTRQSMGGDLRKLPAINHG